MEQETNAEQYSDGLDAVWETEPRHLGEPTDNMRNVAEHNVRLNAAELAKLWATYMGNSMAQRVLSYFRHHVEDLEIQQLLETALRMSRQFTTGVRDIFTQENHPIPIGFSDEDVNLQAPRLFEDEFYLFYLLYTGKAGISLYGTAVPLMVRPDVRRFFTDCLDSTIRLINTVNEVLASKGLLVKPPFIPEADHVDLVKKQSYLNGFFGDVRPLQSLEITHLYDNVQNNAISKAVLIGFSQVAKLNQVTKYFLRGKEMTDKHIKVFSRKLQESDLPSHPLLDDLVTSSTVSPFSDKLMMFHKLDMFAMRIRTYGNSLSFCSRHDLAVLFGRSLLEAGNYVEDGGNIMIDLDWMEQPPQAPDRDALAHQ